MYHHLCWHAYQHILFQGLGPIEFLLFSPTTHHLLTCISASIKPKSFPPWGKPINYQTVKRATVLQTFDQCQWIYQCWPIIICSIIEWLIIRYIIPSISDSLWTKFGKMARSNDNYYTSVDIKLVYLKVLY